ncbi:PREDICTED: nucleoside diphosphate-linked moiety X motif 19 isoform X1 [Drosophila arizonae]|uniref:Nucleoside diphosphate-linked moiety X motif 19 isoform X1 n=2 Tax=Drosophila arizonae TaxID=7263 RepID=A0ABM1NZ16_DROAR|nr:PREDICTED: nucleoside diphosphate-linked moiety X motif 19 isoform X1 [Drosophila arizonae]
MPKKVVDKIRHSASLILLSRDTKFPPSSSDYNALLFTRNSKSTFMPDASVFPGGVCETVDSSPVWLRHFSRYEGSAEKLKKICKGAASTKGSNENLNADVSLRLTALRETFEEMGILLCRDRKSLTRTDGYAQFNEQFDRQHWQRIVHNDASKYLTLCEELDVVPDLWSLHEWSAWRTPSTFQKRFETVFFLAALQAQPQVLTEPNEVKDYKWRAPLDYLKAAHKKELWLPPPQYYELSRCLNFQKLEQLRLFAQHRSSERDVVIHPVIYKCTDGFVHLLPGDDLYPLDPDASSEKIETGISMAEFRALAKKNLHRSEHKNQHESQLIVNFESADGHVMPLDPKTH